MILVCQETKDILKGVDMCNISIGMEFYLTPIVNFIHEAGDKRAGHDLLRESIFFRLLSYCACDLSFQDYKHFAKAAGVPLNQSELVWNVCLAEKVLRLDNKSNSYSAIEWMKERKLLQQDKTSGHKESTTVPKIKKPTPINLDQNDAVKKGQEAIFNETKKVFTDDTTKEQVRPNVRLSRQELASLKNTYSDDEISRMLDKLSEYKSNTGKTYSSDYQAIIRWVCKSINERSSIAKPPTDFPSWLYGETA